MFLSSWSFCIDRISHVNLIAEMVPWGNNSLISLSKVQIEDNKRKDELGHFCPLSIQEATIYQNLQANEGGKTQPVKDFW